MRTTRFELGELFCGAGGLATAANGLTPVTGSEGRTFALRHAWGVDFAPRAIETFNANGCGEGICMDAWEFVRNHLDDSHRVNALAFGFPCNSFSEVGERKGVHDEKFGNLYQTGIAVIQAYDVDWFLAENVSGIGARDQGRQFQTILRELSAAGRGYDVTAHLYRFEEYGVPQARHRYVIVGIRHDLTEKRHLTFLPPAPTHGPGKLPFVTCQDALAALHVRDPTVPQTTMTRTSPRIRERLMFTAPGDNAWTLDRLADPAQTTDEQLLAYVESLPWYAADLAPLNLDAAALRARIEAVRLHCTKARMSHIYRRLDPAKPAWTLTGSGGGGTHVYHWCEHRALTNAERAALQTFPPDYRFCGRTEDIRKQIGMAVPTKGARAIFQAILKTFAKISYDAVKPDPSLVYTCGRARDELGL